MRGERSAVLLAVAMIGCSQDASREACIAGDACTCSDGSPGSQVCRGDGELVACVCAPDHAACPVHSQEYCDGLDNDCNGVVDDGEVCPDATVAHTVPFTGGVYLQGTTVEGTCGTDALQRFWPARTTSYSYGFDCYAQWYRFRRSDNAIYYYSVFAGIRQNTDTTDPIVATPPCGMDVGRQFDFDAGNTLYYQCANTVRRADGVVAAEPIAELVGVLDDGRVIATRSASDHLDYIALDRNGNELSRLSPAGQFAGTLRPVTGAATMAGNRAVVVYLREFAPRKKEIVVFGIDESSAWSRVRRVEVPAFGYAQLAIPDGTVFVREPDPDNHNSASERITAYRPDGTTAIAWREVDANIHAFSGDQMLVGPP
jgi:hypothetical protein